MAVYVDDMFASYGRMKMCHLIADTLPELLATVDRIGVHRRWLQHPERDYHFDIAKVKRDKALVLGVVPITWRECSLMTVLRRTSLGASAPLVTPALGLELLWVPAAARAAAGLAALDLAARPTAPATPP